MVLMIRTNDFNLGVQYSISPTFEIHLADRVSINIKDCQLPRDLDSVQVLVYLLHYHFRLD